MFRFRGSNHWYWRRHAQTNCGQDNQAFVEMFMPPVKAHEVEPKPLSTTARVGLAVRKVARVFQPRWRAARFKSKT
jgi:hypothetical protein